VSMLRSSKLGDAYADAWQEWEDTGGPSCGTGQRLTVWPDAAGRDSIGRLRPGIAR
jgi:hypothetical protein